MRFAATPSLSIAYHESGPPDGAPAILLHGFPYDSHAYDEVAAILAARGMRSVVPYLRGYGQTRFHSETTMRSGQQAALGCDLRDFMDALSIPRAVVAGYDWGGRAACIVAALWPERVAGLVTGGGYNLFDHAAMATPLPAASEHRLWYQYYFHTPRGEAGLRERRRELCRYIWSVWSPLWAFGDAAFDASAASFDNPDFVNVVLHSYRHRFGYAPGDPALEPVEALLAGQPAITVPSISLEGDSDGLDVAALDAADPDTAHFTGPYRRVILPGIGHNLPQEAPAAFADAVFDLSSRATSA